MPSTQFDISNITSWQAACEEWTTNGSTNYNTFRLTANTTLLVSVLNALSDTSNNFTNFSGTFDGCGNTLTLDGTGTTDISNSLFIDLSGGTIQNFTFDISGCKSLNVSNGFIPPPQKGFLHSSSSGFVNGTGYGTFKNINTINNNSVVANKGGFMIGQYFGNTENQNEYVHIIGCDFSGNINQKYGGGLCGAYLQSLDLKIYDCSINATISGESSGAVGGRSCLQNVSSHFNDSNVDICNNNISVVFNNKYCGAMFGINMGEFCNYDSTINIRNNNITVTNNNSQYIAGLSSLQNSSSVYYNTYNNLRIENNIIKTTDLVSSSTFGSLFYVKHNLLLDTPDGSGSLIITGNDLSGIILSQLPTEEHKHKYLFNDDGVSFFDGAPPEIFESVTIHSNVYGPYEPPPSPQNPCPCPKINNASKHNTSTVIRQFSRAQVNSMRLRSGRRFR
jgi:hypothetical protein